MLQVCYSHVILIWGVECILAVIGTGGPVCYSPDAHGSGLAGGGVGVVSSGPSVQQAEHVRHLMTRGGLLLNVLNVHIDGLQPPPHLRQRWPAPRHLARACRRHLS
eukprot:18552-Pyramimonas_sp.AAC.1